MTFERPFSRRKLLKVGGATLAASYLGASLAQESPNGRERLRIGMVLPTTTGAVAVRAATYQVAADAARAGATMAEEDFGAQAEQNGQLLELRIATAPDAEAALRAAERLTSIEEVFAFAGGFGDGVAAQLSTLAAKRELPFFNIGSASNTLRGAGCNRYTFHVEASAAMYLDAITRWYADEDYRRWHFVYPDDDVGRELYASAQRSLARLGDAAEEVGASPVDPATLEYTAAFSQIRESGADVVLLLLDAVSQLSFLGEFDNFDIDAQVTGFPDPTTQTRTFLVASRNGAPRSGTGYRASLWEAKLQADGAERLNQRFRERWGAPMDGPAWAAYHTVKLLFEAVNATQTQEAEPLVDYLENPDTRFDLLKGTDLSFRPWDHQLRQPLYMIKINPNATDAYTLANLVDEMPPADASGAERLDQIGLRAADSQCQL